MYKITKEVDGTKTFTLTFKYVGQALEVFNDLRYDEFVTFKKLYDSGIKKEIREEKIDGELIYREHKLSVPSFNVIITLEYV